MDFFDKSTVEKVLLAKAKKGDPEAQYNLANFYVLYNRHNEEIYWFDKAANNPKASRRQRGVAFYNIGICYDRGEGVARNLKRAFEYFQRAAGLNCPEAIYNLAGCYYGGEGVEQNFEKAFKCYQKAAGMNHLEAVYNLGVCYDKGIGVDQDFEKAFDCWRKLEDLDYPEVLYNLGIYYFIGKGVDKNFEKAFECYQKAADLDYSKAFFNLAGCYWEGKGTTQNFDKAFDYWRKAADLNDHRVLYNLGLCYSEGKGTEQDFGKAFECWQKAAYLNNPEAIFSLGCCYFDGEGTEIDFEKAFECWRKAADLNCLEAISNLGLCYSEGKGTEQDFGKAFECYQKAADLNNPKVIYNLGVCYHEGKGTEQDFEKAFECFQKAADSNNPEAIYNLGVCYHEGKGTEQDFEKAFECFQKAADLNDPGAICNLGVCYSKGEGTEQDFRKAFECYQRAADLNGPEAICNLGLCYHEGEGTEQDFEKAFECYQKASECGDPDNEAYGKCGLGELYLEGLGVEKDFEKAVELFEESGKGGYSFAYSELGLIYSSESISGEEKNLNTAARYFLKDKEFFDEQNMYLLMKESCERAWEWAEDETDEGNVSVSSHVALYYLLGIGTEKKCRKAIDILSADSHKDDVFSLLILGNCYAMGWGGCDVDILQASELQRRAVEIDSEAAKEKQKELSKEIKYAQESQEEQIASLKKERDELQSKQKEIEKENRHFKDVINDLVPIVCEIKTNTATILYNQGQHSDRLDEISGKVDSLTSLVTEFKNENSGLIEKIESLQTQVDSSAQAIGEKISELFEAESKLSGEMEKLTQGETEKAANRVECKQILSNLKALFGEWWDKLDEYTQNALVTGQYLFDSLEKSSDIRDYSSVCVTVCSALEHHLKQILFFGLQNYLENKKIEVTEWPKLLVFADRQSGEISKNDGRSFTLGSIPYFLGFKKSNTCDEKLIEILDEYLKTVTGNPDFSIENGMKSISERIETITVKYRNPAAHTSSVNSALASDCLKAVVGREDALLKKEEVKGIILELAILFSKR